MKYQVVLAIFAALMVEFQVFGQGNLNFENHFSRNCGIQSKVLCYNYGETDLY